MNPEPQQSEGRPVFKTLLTLAATYLGTLAIIAYPLGFLTLWIQIWREYTHDAATAVYAVSLVPVAVVVVKAFAALGTALFFVMGISGTAGQSIALYGAIDLDGEETRTRLSGSRFRRFWQVFLFDRRWRAVYFLNGVFVAAFVPWVAELVSIDSGVDTFFYTCSVLMAGGGAAIGTSMLFKHLNEQHDLRAIYAKALPIMISPAPFAARKSVRRRTDSTPEDSPYGRGRRWGTTNTRKGLAGRQRATSWPSPSPVDRVSTDYTAWQESRAIDRVEEIKRARGERQTRGVQTSSEYLRRIGGVTMPGKCAQNLLPSGQKTFSFLTRKPSKQRMWRSFCQPCSSRLCSRERSSTLKPRRPCSWRFE